jgi:hypothetical protein
VPTRIVLVSAPPDRAPAQRERLALPQPRVEAEEHRDERGDRLGARRREQRVDLLDPLDRPDVPIRDRLGPAPLRAHLPPERLAEGRHGTLVDELQDLRVGEDAGDPIEVDPARLHAAVLALDLRSPPAAQVRGRDRVEPAAA